MKNILFVCTGNMCRSPMAEYMLRAAIDDGSGWHVSSAGTMAGEGMDASANAVDAVREIGIDMTEHKTRGLTKEILNASDVIVAMSQAHIDQILEADSSVEEKMFLLRSFDPDADTRDVPDPVGWDIDVYRGTREMIDGALPGLIEYLGKFEGRDVQ